MRTILLAYTLLTLVACSTDDLIPCSKNGQQGKLCKEYRYLNGAPSGFVDHEHDGDSVLTSRFYDDELRLQKTIINRFENGRTSIISEQWPGRASNVRTYHYNEMDSLAGVHYGANDSVMEFDYHLGKRQRVSVFHKGVLNRYDEYRYFLDDGKLYRVYSYNNADSLLSYLSFEYFSSGHLRQSHYSADHHLIDRRIFSFAPDGLITSVELTDSLGQVAERTEYLYSGQNVIELNRTTSKNRFKSVFLYY